MLVRPIFQLLFQVFGPNPAFQLNSPSSGVFRRGLVGLNPPPQSVKPLPQSKCWIQTLDANSSMNGAKFPLGKSKRTASKATLFNSYHYYSTNSWHVIQLFNSQTQLNSLVATTVGNSAGYMQGFLSFLAFWAFFFTRVHNNPPPQYRGGGGWLSQGVGLARAILALSALFLSVK